MAIGFMAIVGALLGANAVAQSMLQAYPPWISGRARQTYADNPNVAPGIADLVAMRYRDKVNVADFTTTARELGFDPVWSERIFLASQRKLDGEAYVRIWRRAEIDEQTLDKHLTGLFYSGDDIVALKKATEFFPSPIDLVRFAVREVYNETIRARFNLDEDISPTYLAEAAKAGLPDTQARNYWASHWDLPSVSQGFEMVHRAVIEESDLDLLLKALDIVPFWRDKLKEISYHPYTRVDVRRMHKLGILSSTQVKRAYMDLGYDDEKAEGMTQFTLAYNTGSDTEVSKSTLTSAYKMGIIDPGRLSLLLSDIGYSKEAVDFYVTIADYEKVLSETTELQNDLIDRYRRGAITIDGVRQGLAKEGLPSAYIENVLSTELRHVSQKLKMPTRADLESWIKRNIITDVQYANSMRDLGYRDTDIEHYLTEIAQDIEVESIKYLPIKTYQRWILYGITSENRFIEIAEDMKYSAEDIANLILETKEV